MSPKHTANLLHPEAELTHRCGEKAWAHCAVLQPCSWALPWAGPTPGASWLCPAQLCLKGMVT